MCRNYQEYKWKPYWSQIGTFQKSVHKQFLEIVSLTLEEDVKWKIRLLQKCGEFYANNSGAKIWPNPSPYASEKPVFVEPRRGPDRAHGWCGHPVHRPASPLRL